MKISIIVVTLNAGDELRATVKSILTQTYRDIEVIVKDGISTDGSVSKLPEDKRLRVILKSDQGIYDAMNQALEEATGDYVIFVNCGDYLYDENVLQNLSSYATSGNRLIYGDIYDRSSRSRVPSNPEIDDFACFRNVPCHQACLYEREMLLMHPFDIKYKVRADYEQFLWCFYIAKASPVYTGEIICSYMGGGFSDEKKNRKLSEAEHREIVSNYMTPDQIKRFKRRMRLTLAPLRRIIASNPVTGGLYNRLKSAVYDKKAENMEQS